MSNRKRKSKKYRPRISGLKKDSAQSSGEEPTNDFNNAAKIKSKFKGFQKSQGKNRDSQNLRRGNR